MADRARRDQALLMLSEMTEKEFAEFFYEATANRNTSDVPDAQGWFVLAEVEATENGPRELDFIALHSSEEAWVDDAPICQSGSCATCGHNVRSWSKWMRCPICKSEVYGT